MKAIRRMVPRAMFVPAPFKFGSCLAAVLFSLTAAHAQQFTLTVDPAQTSVHFTLGAMLHTVHGSFQLRQGMMQLDPPTGKMSGEIVVDALSGNTENESRDKKMHKDVLQSQRYAEISFRPDRVDGTVALQGKSTVQVHGIFSIHGGEHEITIPAEVAMAADHWTGTLHFAVPYVKWGMKNPSNFLLRVTDSVIVEITAVGSVSKAVAQ